MNSRPFSQLTFSHVDYYVNSRPLFKLRFALFRSGLPPLTLIQDYFYVYLSENCFCNILSPLSVFLFCCISHSLSLSLSSCLGYTMLLIELPFLCSLLTRMFFLPNTYDVVVFCCFFCFFFVFSFLDVYVFLLLVSSVSLVGDDILCWLLSCSFSSVWFSCYFSRTCSRFDLVWFRLSCDHGWIRSGSVIVKKQQQLLINPRHFLY